MTNKTKAIVAIGLGSESRDHLPMSLAVRLDGEAEIRKRTLIAKFASRYSAHDFLVQFLSDDPDCRWVNLSTEGM